MYMQNRNRETDSRYREQARGYQKGKGMGEKEN